MTVEEQMRQLVGSITRPPGAEIGNETDLLESGVIDSGGVYELLGLIEEQFRYVVPDSEVVPDNFRSIPALAAMVSRGIEPPD
jgi:acyl carrier protein